MSYVSVYFNKVDLSPADEKLNDEGLEDEESYEDVEKEDGEDEDKNEGIRHALCILQVCMACSKHTECSICFYGDNCRIEVFISLSFDISGPMQH